MYVVTINANDRESLDNAMRCMRDIVEYHYRGDLYDLRIGIDPLDNGLKFSVNGSTWTPPFRGKVNDG